MGIFFDTCNALIDPTTGRALTGEALERAQNDPKWPRCGNRVSKRARFCNACGKPAPGGWWKWPQCGKWIGNDSHFCPHCNAPLYPTTDFPAVYHGFDLVATLNSFVDYAEDCRAGRCNPRQPVFVAM